MKKSRGMGLSQLDSHMAWVSFPMCGRAHVLQGNESLEVFFFWLFIHLTKDSHTCLCQVLMNRKKKPSFDCE